MHLPGPAASVPRAALAALAVLLGGCVRNLPLEPGLRGVILSDARDLPPGASAGPGPGAVVASRRVLEGGVPVVVYRPAAARDPAPPAVVFLPGLLAPEWQYESYALALSSRGFVVAVRDRYSPFIADAQLAADAGTIAQWLIDTRSADPARIGVAGHSMGAKDAIFAAALDGRFSAVVALEPDDQGELSVARGALQLLRVPLLLVGAEVAWKGWQICCPREHNYQQFFERSPPGTVELTLRDADHVQVMDQPDAFGQVICRVGTADSRSVRNLARGATVDFFVAHLLRREPFTLAPVEGTSVRVKR